MGLVLAASAASVSSAVVGFHDHGGAALPVAVTCADVAGLWLGLTGAALLASRRSGSGRLRTDFGFRVGSVWDLVVGAAVGLASQYLLVPALYLPFEQVDHHLRHSLGRPAHQEAGSAHGLLAVIVLVAFLAVGAPVVEELFFRGLVLRGLLGRIPTPLAIVVAALLFALAHFEPVQFAGLAVFGVVLGLLAWRTARLGPGMAAHAAFNASALITIVHLH